MPVIARSGRLDRPPRPGIRSLAVVAVLLAATGVPLAASAPPACAERGRHAGLVVDTGHEVLEYCVVMSSDAVSGTELIQLASEQHGLDYRLGFGGKAVCRLDGVGTDSGDCFDQFPNFWGYWRAGPGGNWSWSSTGAADTSVGSGGIEGWVWGTGQDGTTHASPPATTIDQLCGTRASPPPGGGGGGGGSGGGGHGGGGHGGGGHGGGSGGDGSGGTGGGQRQPDSAGSSAGSDKAGSANTAPSSQANGRKDDAGAGTKPAGGEGGSGATDPATASTSASDPDSGPESTEAALTARTTDPSGVPFGALLALAAALALGIGGALMLRRSGSRGR